MNNKLLIVGVVAAGLATSPTYAFQTLVELGVEARAYTESAPEPAHSAKLALSLQPEFTHEYAEQNLYLTFEPFFRVDQYDDQRDHADIRELKAIKVYDNWELEGGIGQIFWGVAESNHLVDIINQTDYLEGIDGEDKLGQPMFRASRIFDQSTLSGFVLLGFREREFLGPESRFSLPFPINADQARFESDDEEQHIDYALRYSGYAGFLDYGLSWFDGTARQPEFVPATPGSSTMVPYYQQVERYGVDMQYTIDAWLWKLEALHQRSEQPSFSAYVGGVEYTFYNMHDGAYDLGLLAEYSYDSRDDPQRVFLQNDVFVGMRFGFTDAQSSSILAGAFVDLDDDSQIYRIEASRRVFDDATLSLEMQAFSNIAQDNISYTRRNNDFLMLNIAWYF